MATAVEIAKKKLQVEVDRALDVISNAKQKAAHDLAIAAADALKVTNIKGSDDHDLLIELRTLMTVLQLAVADIKNGTSAQIADHETRLKDVEKKVSNTFITTAIYTLATIALITLMVSHMLIK